jgi:hypothetical protein
MGELKSKNIPLLKETHIDKIVRCLECIKDYPYNRERQKECILNIYPEKSEKSVFRGMVIPTLRKTGLILGFGSFIRISANGSLIVESKRKSEALHARTKQAMILDIDRRKIGFVQELFDLGSAGKSISGKRFRELLASEISSPSTKQSMERVDRWIRILKQVGLLTENEHEVISINMPIYKQATADLAANGLKLNTFTRYLLESCKELIKEVGAIVDIADLRERVAIKLLNNENEILTEYQFDERFREIPLATDKYFISLGRPMGAEEKLFFYNGKHYRTLIIQFVGGE